MNYYEFHIGDYLKNTAHLSMLEDAAYRRMIDAYYTRESPLPLDRRACYKLARAQSKDERLAVDYVLDEFFEEREDGMHNQRCDDEIERFKDKQSKAKRSAEARWSKHHSQSEGNANASPDAMRTHMQTHSEGSAPRARPQTPVTSNQTPEVNQREEVDGTVGVRAPSDSHSLTDTARVCKGLKALGYGDTNPHDMTLSALLSAGLTADEILAVGEEYRGKSKGFRYILKAAEGRRRDAATVATLPEKQAESRLSPAGKKTAEAAQRWLQSQESRQ